VGRKKGKCAVKVNPGSEAQNLKSKAAVHGVVIILVNHCTSSPEY